MRISLLSVSLVVAAAFLVFVSTASSVPAADIVPFGHAWSYFESLE